MKRGRRTLLKLCVVVVVTAAALLGVDLFGGLSVGQSPVSADLVLWSVGSWEQTVRDDVAALQLGSVASVSDISQLGNAKSLLLVDAAVAGIDDAGRAKLRSHLGAGGAIVVVGNGESVRKSLGLNPVAPTFAVERTSTEMRVDANGVEEALTAPSAPRREFLPFRFYGVAINTLGYPNEVYHASAASEAARALRELIVWSVTSAHAVETVQGPVQLGSLAAGTVHTLDSMGSDWINYQYVEWFIHDGTRFDERTKTMWWKLNDIYGDRDWYLIEVVEDTYISDFHCGTDNCGYWISNRYNKVDLDTYDDAFHASALDDWGPPTDTSDAATESYSVGLSLSSSAVGGSAGVSRTISKPSVFVHAARDYTYKWVEWREEFRGPDYGLWPISVNPPAAVSHEAYYTTHSTIDRVTGGLSSTPNGMRARVENKFEVIDDLDLHWCNLIFVCWTRWTYTYPQSGDVSANVYWDSPGLVSPGNGGTLSSGSVTLDWSGPSSANYWYVVISRSGWSSSSYRSTTDWPVSLSYGYTYTWRVYSRTSAGAWSVAGPAWTFTVSSGGGGGGGGGPLAYKM